MDIVLSSTSPARLKLMRRTKIAFTCFAPNIDESLHPNETAEDAVKRLAIGKAKAAQQQHPNALIIGCDQLVTVNKHIIGKPLTHTNAVKQLALCSEQILHSYTGLCLYNSASQQVQTDVVLYQVKFKKLSDKMIEHYLAIDQPYHCAGSIKAECFGFSLFEWMRGNDPAALTGLPLISLNNMLLNENFDTLKTAISTTNNENETEKNR
jgi:septum formation protein